MATKTNKNGARTTQKGDYGVDFVNISLSTREKEQIHSAVVSGDELISTLIRLVEGGVKVSFSYSERTASVVCTLTLDGVGEAGRKVAFSSFGASLEGALKSAWYKYNLVTDGGQWDLAQNAADYGGIG